VKGLNPYRFKALHDFPGFALDCVSLCHKIVLNTSLFLFLLKIKRRKNVFNTFLVALRTVTLSRQANGNRPCKGGSFFKSVPFGAWSPHSLSYHRNGTNYEYSIAVSLLTSVKPLSTGLVSNTQKITKPRKFRKERKAKTSGMFLVEKRSFILLVEVCIDLSFQGVFPIFYSEVIPTSYSGAVAGYAHVWTVMHVAMSVA